MGCKVCRCRIVDFKSGRDTIDAVLKTILPFMRSSHRLASGAWRLGARGLARWHPLGRSCWRSLLGQQLSPSSARWRSYRARSYRRVGVAGRYSAASGFTSRCFAASGAGDLRLRPDVCRWRKRDVRVGVFLMVRFLTGARQLYLIAGLSPVYLHQ